MQFLHKVKLVQGGMGAYVSNWRLARTVAMERPGTIVGTVSGTGLDVIYVRLLQLGDPGGHVRRALAAFAEANAPQQRWAWGYAAVGQQNRS